MSGRREEFDENQEMTGRAVDPLDLADYAERARVGDWSLRSALVRYAQPQPRRAGAVLELVRRTDGALKPFTRPAGAERAPEALVGVAVELDHLGDVLAGWATDVTAPRPDDEVDRVSRRVFDALAALGVERESPPPRRRG